MISENVKKLGPIIIESLGPDDKKTGQLFHCEILRYKTFENPNLTSLHFDAQSENDFIGVLVEIIRLIKEEKFFPLLHVEAHGSDDGLFLASNETITWQTLMPYLVEINTLLHNRLILSLGACYGINLLSAIDVSKRAPFKCIIATTKSITEQQLINAFETYFDSYYFSFDTIESVNKMNHSIGSEMFFHVTEQYCFDRITDPNVNLEKFKDNIKKIAFNSIP